MSVVDAGGARSLASVDDAVNGVRPFNLPTTSSVVASSWDCGLVAAVRQNAGRCLLLPLSGDKRLHAGLCRDVRDSNARVVFKFMREKH